MNKEQQELSEGAACLHGWYRPECNSCNPNANNFDPDKVRRVQLHVDAAYWVRDEDYDQLLAMLSAKDALIASLKAEILKQNKAEDELLATGEKLAEERA